MTFYTSIWAGWGSFYGLLRWSAIHTPSKTNKNVLSWCHLNVVNDAWSGARNSRSRWCDSSRWQRVPSGWSGGDEIHWHKVTFSLMMGISVSVSALGMIAVYTLPVLLVGQIQWLYQRPRVLAFLSLLRRNSFRQPPLPRRVHSLEVWMLWVAVVSWKK